MVLRGLTQPENAALLSPCHRQITAIRLQLFAAGGSGRLSPPLDVDDYF
jgi:hypothetical protein